MKKLNKSIITHIATNTLRITGLPLCVNGGKFNMETLVGIYKITNPKNKIYIGQSLNITQRFLNYKQSPSKTQRRIYNSLKKYGFSNHKFEVLHLCDKEQLNVLEKYYIDLFNTFNTKHGLNLRDGGGSRGAFSDESKKQLSKTRKSLNIKYDDEYKIKMSKKLSGEKNPMYGKSGEFSPNWGKKHKAETIEKMKKNHWSKSKTYINPNKNKPNTEEQKLKAKHTKKINRIKKHGIYIVEYNNEISYFYSVNQIAKKISVNISSVYRAIHNDRKLKSYKIKIIKPNGIDETQKWLSKLETT
jgi:hypothetical protein